MSIVKKQHYVPKFYLSRWIKHGSSEQLYVYNKERKKSYSANIKDISSSRYFYDYPKLNKEQKADLIDMLKKDESISAEQYEDIIKFVEGQGIEKALGEVETINAPVLSKIIQKLESLKALPLEYFRRHSVFTSTDILELSYYIALQYSRTEETRISIEHMTEALVKQVSDITLENIDKLENDATLMEKMGEDNFKLLSESVKNGKFTKDSYTIAINETYTKIQHIQQLFKITESIADIIVNYKWTILVNTTNIPFYTSDSPVIKKANMNNPFYSNGFLSKGIELFFPISPKYAINVFEPSFLHENQPLLLDINIAECSKENVIHYNDLLIQKSTSQVYSNINDFKWVVKRIKNTPEVANKSRKRVIT